MSFSEAPSSDSTTVAKASRLRLSSEPVISVEFCLMVGQTVSHYKIRAKIGEGGMGVVYLADDLKLERQVALKFLPADYTVDPEIKSRFWHEAKAAASLNHPNIATVHAIEECDDKVFIVMEFIEVDDEPINQQVLANHLGYAKYRVTMAMDGEQALKILKSGQKFDMVLLDVMMPRMSGYKVCEKIRETYLPSELPVIMVTAKNQVGDLVTGLGSGANDYLAKPFSKDELLARIKTHLNMQRINSAYGRFVPHEFLRFLGKESIIDVNLGDHALREMTIFVSDIRSFTSLSETMTPVENFEFINAYLGRVSPIIRDNGGIVDRYSGDSIMALFPNKAEDAIRSALLTLKSLAEYNAEGKDGIPPIQIGIGLHTGSLMLGIVGEHQRAQGDIFSDAVNLANRIEGLSKLYGVLDTNPGDKTARFYLERSAQFMVQGVPDNWEGVEAW